LDDSDNLKQVIENIYYLFLKQIINISSTSFKYCCVLPLIYIKYIIFTPILEVILLLLNHILNFPTDHFCYTGFKIICKQRSYIISNFAIVNVTEGIYKQFTLLYLISIVLC